MEVRKGQLYSWNANPDSLVVSFLDSQGRDYRIKFCDVVFEVIRIERNPAASMEDLAILAVIKSRDEDFLPGSEYAEYIEQIRAGGALFGNYRLIWDVKIEEYGVYCVKCGKYSEYAIKRGDFECWSCRNGY